MSFQRGWRAKSQKADERRQIYAEQAPIRATYAKARAEQQHRQQLEAAERLLADADAYLTERRNILAMYQEKAPADLSAHVAAVMQVEREIAIGEGIRVAREANVDRIRAEKVAA